MQRRAVRHPAIPMFTLLAASATAVVFVGRVRPQLSGSIISWRGDDLAFATTWLLALIGAAWLTLTTLACLAAMARGEPLLAHRIAGWAPPIARRLLQTALIGGWALVPAHAYAATPAPPVTVQVGSSGRLTVLPADPRLATAAPSTDVPVVRAPRTGPAPVDQPRATPAPAVSAAHPSPQQSRAAIHVVAAGENLWQIAKAEVSHASGTARPDDHAVGAYWQRVVTANRGTLRSGNPSLIFSGEVVTLPASGTG